MSEIYGKERVESDDDRAQPWNHRSPHHTDRDLSRAYFDFLVGGR